MSVKFKGAIDNLTPRDQRVDTRDAFTKMDQSLRTSDGSQKFALAISCLCVVGVFAPIFTLFLIPFALLLTRFYLIPEKRLHDMPYRVPKHANLPDGSFDAIARKVSIFRNPEKAYGQ